jgi:hypothetical protein
MSPLARALMKSSPGDRVTVHAPTKTEHLEIVGGIARGDHDDVAISRLRFDRRDSPDPEVLR